MVQGSPSNKEDELLFVVSPHSGVLQKLDTDARLLCGLKAPVTSGVRPNHFKDQPKGQTSHRSPRPKETKAFSSHDYCDPD
jgi:hypothetical protein